MTARRTTLLAAFLAVYLIWGSTYLGIRFAIETIPPLTLSAARFGLAGLILLAVAAMRGVANATRAQWRTGIIVGALLMTGNACVGLAEERIPSGVAALLVAMTPVFMVLLEWVRPRGRRPTLGVIVGLLIGLGGVATLVGPGSFGGGTGVDPVGAAIVIFGSFAWSLGSIYSRHAPRAQSAVMMTAMQMFAGGIFVGLMAAVSGELGRFDPAAVSGRSLAALAYLLVFGSLIAFTAYVYLLRVSTPARVATYAYVNPVVAVILGWAFAGEAISVRMLLAAAIIVAGVAIITAAEGRSPVATAAARSSTAREGPIPRHTGDFPVIDRT